MRPFVHLVGVISVDHGAPGEGMGVAFGHPEDAEADGAVAQRKRHEKDLLALVPCLYYSKTGGGCARGKRGFLQKKGQEAVPREGGTGNGKKAMELLSHTRKLSKLIDAADSKSGLLIGSELHDPALNGLSIAVTHYTASPQCSGAIALIGPVRMNYPKIISTLEYVAQSVESLLADMLDV